jgi:predicted DNA binding CopG/RHH family protein
MANDRSAVSDSGSYAEMAEFWDTHSLADHATTAADFEVDSTSSAVYFAVDKELAARVRAVASSEGLSAETLLNRWLHERVNQR